MSETKDPAIKLFGKTIPLPDIEAQQSQCYNEAPSCDRKTDDNQDDATHTFTSHEMTDPNETSLTDDNPKTPNTDNESPSTPNTEEEKDETTNSEENKTLKKPDKILPCPRCKSMETKFCYFNNYNVTQPRYFCKKCQRYWTAGGTMRNVPVGAGRRKNKNSVPHFRQVSVSVALQDPRLGSHYPIVRPNGTVLTFRNGFEEPVNLGILEKTIQDFGRSGLHEPVNLKIMEKSIQDAQNGLCGPVNLKILEKTIQNYAHKGFHEPLSIEAMEKTVQDCTRNGFHGPVNLKIPEKTIQDCAHNGVHEPVKLKIPQNVIQDCSQNGFRNPVNLQIPVPYGGLKNRDEQPSVSSITDTNIKDKHDNNGTNNVLMQNFQSYPLQVPVFAGPTWPYNTAQWVPPPGVYPMPFYPPPPYWGCAMQPPWTLPWVTMPLSTSPVSPTLGKHSRDEDSSRGSEEGEEKRESGSERSLWVPKTLRIDNPGEAAKSSLWATLGIKHDRCDIARKGSLFKAFKSRADEERDNSDNLPVLLANPAALSRSRNFQESS